jgi:predicted ATPase/DNA-binding XRE family transcriptional regulator
VVTRAGWQENGSQADQSRFAHLLRWHRLALGLTQEALAERAALSVEAISALERGSRRRPQLHTLDRLTRALDLAPAAAETFRRTARPASPRPTTPRVTPTDLGTVPAPMTDLIGRAAEVAATAQLIRGGGARLLTLTGPPGVGKTRTALAVAAAVRGNVDQIFYIDLAPIVDPDLVPATMGRIVTGRDVPSARALGALTTHLGERRTLLLVDNFEQVLPAAVFLQQLLMRCAHTLALVTSRAALRVRGEHEITVSPLATPPADGCDPAVILGYPAVALFLARAQSVRHDFTVDEATATQVAEVCRRLDGLPLALELAAARLRLLDPGALLDGARRLPLLVAGARDLPSRQQTMRAALAWSHDLLDPAERAMLRRLSVFANPIPVDAAISVCAAAGAPIAATQATQATDGIPADPTNRDPHHPDRDPLDLLFRLLDHNLVRRDPSGDEPSVTMLETVREYGRELLDAAGETAVTALAHAEWWIALAEAAEPELITSDRDRWILRLQRSHDNIRTTLQWSLDTGHLRAGLRLSGRLWRFWDAQGHWSEGRAWLDRLIALAADEPDDIRARADNGAGNLAWRQTDYPASIDYYESSLALSRAAGDDEGAARALGNLAAVTSLAGRVEAAIPLHEESLALRRRIGDLDGVAATLNNLAVAMVHIGELDRAIRLLEEALVVKTRLGDRAGQAICLSNLADLDRRAGDHARALTRLRDCVAEMRELHDDGGLAYALHTLGDTARDAGDPDANVYYQESLAIRLRLGDTNGIAYCLEGIAAVAASLALHVRAARLLGAATAIREAAGAPRRGAYLTDHDRLLSTVRAGLATQHFTEAWQAGAALSLAEAAAEASTESG